MNLLHVFVEALGSATRRQGNLKNCNCGKPLPTLELEGWARPPEEVGTMHFCSRGTGTTDFKALSYPHVYFIFPYGGRCFEQRERKKGRPWKIIFCFTNTLGVGTSHMMELVKEDFKKRETRQSCGIINYDKIKIKQRWNSNPPAALILTFSFPLWYSKPWLEVLTKIIICFSITSCS